MKPEDVRFAASPWGHQFSGYLGKVEGCLWIASEPRDTWSDRFVDGLYQIEIQVQAKVARRGGNLVTRIGLSVEPFGAFTILQLEGVAFTARF